MVGVFELFFLVFESKRPAGLGDLLPNRFAFFFSTSAM